MLLPSNNSVVPPRGFALERDSSPFEKSAEAEKALHDYADKLLREKENGFANNLQMQSEGFPAHRGDGLRTFARARLYPSRRTHERRSPPPRPSIVNPLLSAQRVTMNMERLASSATAGPARPLFSQAWFESLGFSQKAALQLSSALSGSAESLSICYRDALRDGGEGTSDLAPGLLKQIIATRSARRLRRIFCTDDEDEKLFQLAQLILREEPKLLSRARKQEGIDFVRLAAATCDIPLVMAFSHPAPLESPGAFKRVVKRCASVFKGLAETPRDPRYTEACGIIFMHAFGMLDPTHTSLPLETNIAPDSTYQANIEAIRAAVKLNNVSLLSVAQERFERLFESRVFSNETSHDLIQSAIQFESTEILTKLLKFQALDAATAADLSGQNSICFLARESDERQFSRTCDFASLLLDAGALPMVALVERTATDLPVFDRWPITAALERGNLALAALLDMHTRGRRKLFAHSLHILANEQTSTKEDQKLLQILQEARYHQRPLSEERRIYLATFLEDVAVTLASTYRPPFFDLSLSSTIPLKEDEILSRTDLLVAQALNRLETFDMRSLGSLTKGDPLKSWRHCWAHVFRFLLSSYETDSTRLPAILELVIRQALQGGGRLSLSENTEAALALKQMSRKIVSDYRTPFFDANANGNSRHPLDAAQLTARARKLLPEALQVAHQISETSRKTFLLKHPLDSAKHLWAHLSERFLENQRTLHAPELRDVFVSQDILTTRLFSSGVKFFEDGKVLPRLRFAGHGEIHERVPLAVLARDGSDIAFKNCLAVSELWSGRDIAIALLQLINCGGQPGKALRTTRMQMLVNHIDDAEGVYLALLTAFRREHHALLRAVLIRAKDQKIMVADNALGFQNLLVGLDKNHLQLVEEFIGSIDPSHRDTFLSLPAGAGQETTGYHLLVRLGPEFLQSVLPHLTGRFTRLFDVRNKWNHDVFTDAVVANRPTSFALLAREVKNTPYYRPALIVALSRAIFQNTLDYLDPCDDALSEASPTDAFVLMRAALMGGHVAAVRALFSRFPDATWSREEVRDHLSDWASLGVNTRCLTLIKQRFASNVMPADVLFPEQAPPLFFPRFRAHEPTSAASLPVPIDLHTYRDRPTLTEATRLFEEIREGAETGTLESKVNAFVALARASAAYNQEPERNLLNLMSWHLLLHLERVAQTGAYGIGVGEHLIDALPECFAAATGQETLFSPTPRASFDMGLRLLSLRQHLLDGVLAEDARAFEPMWWSASLRSSEPLFTPREAVHNEGACINLRASRRDQGIRLSEIALRGV